MIKNLNEIFENVHMRINSFDFYLGTEYGDKRGSNQELTRKQTQIA